MHILMITSFMLNISVLNDNNFNDMKEKERKEGRKEERKKERKKENNHRCRVSLEL